MLLTADGLHALTEDGTHGSREQSGPFYDPAEEQLKHLPEGLRKKCAVVDTTKMTPEETRDAMEQYAQSGRVTSGPAAVGGPARKPSEREKKEFDEMLRKMSVKADAYNGADEPSFALKFDKKKSKASSLTEFDHECTKIPFPAREIAHLTTFSPTQLTSLHHLRPCMQSYSSLFPQHKQFVLIFHHSAWLGMDPWTHSSCWLTMDPVPWTVRTRPLLPILSPLIFPRCPRI